MTNLRFTMAGSGNWGPLFPDEQARRLYKRVYGGQVTIGELAAEERDRVSLWQDADVVAGQGHRILARIPIYSPPDAVALSSWFAEATRGAADIIKSNAGDYRALTADLSVRVGAATDHLLAILICAQTLDVGTLRELENGILGHPPTRARTGTYFVWGDMTPEMEYFFGVNSYSLGYFRVSMIHAPAITRTMLRPGAVSIPVFDAPLMERVNDLCLPICRRLAESFSHQATKLSTHLQHCSFSACSRGDYLCMLFHLGYAHVAKLLVAENILHRFPTEVRDGWGLWIHPM